MAAGMSRASDPAGSAAGLEATIDAAVTDLDRSIMEAKLNEDPLRFALQAQASFLRAIQRLYAEATITIGDQIAAAKQPPVVVNMAELSRAAADRVVYELPGAVDRLVLQRSRRLMLMVAAGAMLFLVLGVVGGWILRGDWPGEALAGFTCADQADGSRLCYKYVRDPAAVINPAKR
jgi:hypothetical protein